MLQWNPQTIREFIEWQEEYYILPAPIADLIAAITQTTVLKKTGRNPENTNIERKRIMKTHDVSDGKGNTTTYRDNDDNSKQNMDGDGCWSIFGSALVVIMMLVVILCLV